MRTLIHILTLFFAATAVFLAVSFYLGAQNNTLNSGSSAILGFQVYGSVSAILALIFALWGRALNKKNERPMSWISGLGIFAALTAFIILIKLSFFS